MLNAVKHLYRIVERMRNSVVELFFCTRRNHRFLLVSVFQYSVLLSCLLLVSNSQAQTYLIKTLEGTNTTVKIRNRTTSIPFSISCSTDKLILPNYWAGGEIKILNRKFLEIRYYIRGGSGVGRGNTLLLCVSRGKLRQAMHIESYSSDLNYSSDSNPELTTQKIIDTRLALDATDNAHVITYDTLVSGENKNFQRNSIAPRKRIIQFDLNQRIFCSYQKKINTSLIGFNYKANCTTTKHFSGIAPGFQLNHSQYIFVSGNWYIKDDMRESYFLVD